MAGSAEEARRASGAASSRPPPPPEDAAAAAAAVGPAAAALEAKVERALACPCVDEFVNGPCGTEFREAFSWRARG